MLMFTEEKDLISAETEYKIEIKESELTELLKSKKLKPVIVSDIQYTFGKPKEEDIGNE